MLNNLKKIIAFAAAAASAVTVLSCTVCAGYADDWETVVDKSGLVQVYRVEEQDKDNPSIVNVLYADKDGKKLNGRIYANLSDEYDADPRFLMVEFKDGIIGKRVSGFTKNSEGKRYYINGERAYGWHKIKGYWYHFDIKSGYMDTGKTKIGGDFYTFDEKGRWTYRVSKDGVAPQGFFRKVYRRNSQRFRYRGKEAVLRNKRGGRWSSRSFGENTRAGQADTLEYVL